MEPQQTTPAKRSPVPKWIAEGLLIVVSVLLAFAVDEYRESRSNRDLARRALVGIAAEIEHNQKVVEPYVAFHGKWAGALNAGNSKGATGLDAWFATRPPGVEAPFPGLRRSAWDAAVSSGALRFVDFDVASALADVYGMQSNATDNVQRLATGALSSATTYDPAMRGPSVRLLWLTLADIQSAERLLAGLYKEHLPTVRAAAGLPR